MSTIAAGTTATAQHWYSIGRSSHTMVTYRRSDNALAALTGNVHHAVGPEFVLQVGDILYFTIECPAAIPDEPMRLLSRR